MRRNKRTAWRRIANLVWPEIGFRRWRKYLWHRLARLPGTSYSIAAGFACGAAVSMTPFVGLHFVLAAALAWIIGANVVAGLIGTAVGNPWTFPFIWAWVHELGNWMLPGAADGPPARDFADVFADLIHDSLTLNFGHIADSAWPVVWPMLIGSIPTGIATWIVFYLALRRLIAGYRRQRVRRRAGRGREETRR